MIFTTLIISMIAPSMEKRRTTIQSCLYIMNQEKLRYGEIEQTIKYIYT